MSKELEIKIGDLFKYIEMYENHEFKENQEYFQNTKLEITDEKGKYIPINGMITKKDKILILKFNDNAEIEVSANHKIMTINGLKYCKDLNINDEIQTTNNTKKIIDIIEKSEETVFDFEIDSFNHLYSTADGTIHHNTLITAAITEVSNRMKMNTLIVVPSISLLKQTKEYLDNFNIEIGMLGNGKKELDKKNLISTWQTLTKNPELTKSYRCIIWDECHLTVSASLSKTLAFAENTLMRIGLTGTTPKKKVDKMNLTASIGPILQKVTAKKLQDRNVLSSINIEVIKLKYPKEFKTFIDWQEESMFLQTNNVFKEYLKQLLPTLKNNVLVLMKNVDPTKELANELGFDFISSSFKPEKRQEYFNKFVHNGNYIAFGTYSLLSTGIDIVHINNIILGPTAGKSFSRVIQSIGRGLRRKEGEKEHVTVYDIASNVKYESRHIRDRLSYYKEAEYPTNIKEIDFSKLDPRVF